VSVLSGSRIIVGVSGGIAAYKAADFVSKLVQTGSTVDVAMTEAAEQFVGPITFQALTKRRVYGSVFEPWSESSYGHITLGHEADAIVVIPATANTIAKLAGGHADDMLGAVVLSSSAPLIVVPAMEHEMYRHAATRANLEMLKSRGMVQVGPERGRLASGEMGDGRMSAPETVIGALRMVLGRKGQLAGKRVVISAGGTREALDPIRYLGNRSSGQMGFALAQAAIEAGAAVSLVTSVIGAPSPYGATAIPVQTACEMQHAILSAIEGADILIMAAAVADFRPASSQSGKIKKQPSLDSLQLEIVRTPDILASIDRPDLLKIGFAAETDNLIEYATNKLHEKGLAMIVANDAETTIGSAESTAHFIFPSGESVALPRMPKPDLAVRVIAEIAKIANVSPDA
jgi:phosphopantothenoylcysteine decarboxylase/phosphopantothenate--cysteine ligase